MKSLTVLQSSTEYLHEESVLLISTEYLDEESVLLISTKYLDEESHSVAEFYRIPGRRLSLCC